MKKILLFLTLLVLISVVNAQTPSNDTCANAIEISISNTPVSNTTQNIGEISNATVINEPGCDNTTNDNYVAIWYRFTMPYNGNVRINGLSDSNNFALYDACGGNEIACWSKVEIIESLTAGTEYFLKVFRLQSNANFGATFFRFDVFEASTNDTCNTAELITVPSNQISIFFTIENSVSNIETTCMEPTTTNRIFDAWYSFVMPFDGNIVINSGNNANNFAIYDDCNVTEIACFSRRNIVQNLNAGTIYKIRIFKTFNTLLNTTSPSFQIRAIPTSTNNDCANSETITVSQTENQINFDIAGSSVTNTSCTNSSDDFYDIWYDFTMPIEGNLFINSSGGYNFYTLYDTCNGTEIACFTNNKLIDGLTVGANYKLRVYRPFLGAVNNLEQRFTTIIYPQAPNDTCANAEQTTVTQNPITLTFNVLGADANIEDDCASIQQELFSTWYSFTMPVTGNIEISNASLINSVAVFDNCNGNKIGCVEGDGVISGLLANQTYKMQVFRKSHLVTSTSPQQFDIQAVEAAINDTCDSSQNIAVSTTEITIIFDMSAAQINNEIINCSTATAQDFGDIWYDFTMPVDGNLYINGNVLQNRFAVYDTCNGTILDCFRGNGYAYNLIGGTNYKIRLYRTSDDLNNINNSFKIKAFPQAINETCADAIDVVLDINSPTTIDFQLGGADVNTETGCDTNSFDYVDVWYQFVMPTNGNIDVVNSHPDNDLAIYTDCNSAALQCISGNNTFANLTGGTTYKLRVFRRDYENREVGQSFTMTFVSTLSNSQSELNKQIVVFPTLIEAFLTIKTPLNTKNLELEIYNHLGSKIIARKINQPENLIPLNTLTNGLYFYTIKQENNIIKTGKLIKK